MFSGDFVRKWSGHMINIHPALLPSFKGANAQKMAIEARVAVSGCTVHYVVVSAKVQKTLLTLSVIRRR